MYWYDVYLRPKPDTFLLVALTRCAESGFQNSFQQLVKWNIVGDSATLSAIRREKMFYQYTKYATTNFIDNMWPKQSSRIENDEVFYVQHLLQSPDPLMRQKAFLIACRIQDDVVQLRTQMLYEQQMNTHLVFATWLYAKLIDHAPKCFTWLTDCGYYLPNVLTN